MRRIIVLTGAPDAVIEPIIGLVGGILRKPAELDTLTRYVDQSGSIADDTGPFDVNRGSGCPRKPARQTMLPGYEDPGGRALGNQRSRPCRLAGRQCRLQRTSHHLRNGVALADDLCERLRQHGLRTVAERFFRFVVDLDEHTIGADSDRRP